MAAVHDKMDAALFTLNANSNEIVADVNSQSKPNVDKMSAARSAKYSDMQLDKFKRRLVRAVARYRQQKIPEEKMWLELKKEIGCDCKMLWQHMRALTIKKLKRLLPANDMLANITKVARFTATDWLLFDLILVHENIDVITLNDQQDKSDYTQEEKPECMSELFDLVVKHQAEELTGDELTEAWIRITLDYNSRGRQCSPMLLQLRWYQMKELCRSVFYNFWCSYRGTKRYLQQALAIKPTELQTSIVVEYRKIITKPFPKWEKLIEERRVILSEEFALTRKAEKVREEKEIELIEPQVETIDLASDESEKNCDVPPPSEGSVSGEHCNTPLANDGKNKDDIDISTNSVSIKAEPEDDGVLELDGLSDVEASYIPMENADHCNTTEKLCESSTTEIINLENEIDDESVLPTITSVVSNATEADKCDSEDDINGILEQKAKDLRNEIAHIDSQKHTDLKEFVPEVEMDRILCEKANKIMNIEITQVKSEYDNMKHNINIAKDNAEDRNTSNNMDASRNSEPIQCDSDEEINKIIHEKAERFIRNDIAQTVTKTSDTLPDIPNISETNVNTAPAEPVVALKFEIDIEKDNDFTRHRVSNEKFNDAFDEMDFEDDGIEFVDDGIEFVDEHANGKNKNVKLEIESSSDNDDETNAEENDVPKIDLKLLMDPKVFTKKLDLMEVFKFTDYDNVNDKRVIECALIESKPVDRLAVTEEDMKNFREEALLGSKTDDTQVQNDTDHSEDEFADNRVKSTSWLLQKPKNRSYNPIQLCKNPDFNTRLKRLTAGFLKLTTNRVLLKECKPLTIDLHKAFETKLVNGTIYLKGGDFKSAKPPAPEINNKDLVTPSVIPGQSILNSKTNRTSEATGNCLQSLPKVPCSNSVASERSKVIKLPDIDQVRRVNQGLLTAEVTPIRVDSNIIDTNINKKANRCTTIVSAPVLIEAKETSTIDSASQIKIESPTVVGTLNKSIINSEKAKYPYTPAKDLIAHKTKDPIIDVASQTFAPLADTEKYQGAKGDKKYKKNSLTFFSGKHKRFISSEAAPLTYKAPICRDAVTWSAKYVSSYYADSLLTADTLNKILYLINTDTCEKEKSTNTTQLEADKKEDTRTTTIQQNIPPLQDDKIDSYIKENRIRQLKKARQRRRKLQEEPKPYTGIYCCWAREKLSHLTLKRPLKGHGCLKFNCKCCCRTQLNTMKMKIYDSKRGASSSTVGGEDSMTIVLSDDEEMRMQSGPETRTSEIGKGNSEVATANSNLTSTINNDVCDISNIPVDSTTDQLTETSSNISINPTSQPPPLIRKSSKVSAKNIQPTEESSNNNSAEKYKCKTVVVPAKGHPYGENLQPILPKPPRVNETQKIPQKKKIKISIPPPTTAMSPAFCVTENQNKGQVCFINNIVRNQRLKNPIFLGVNKILLCSLPDAIKVLPQLPILPDGISFMLLPDGTLTLGISSVAELSQHQVCAFPPMMSIIQEELKKNNLVFARTDIENVQIIPENTGETHSNANEHVPPSETNNLSYNSELCNISQATETTQEAVEMQSIDKTNQNDSIDETNTENVLVKDNLENKNEEVLSGMNAHEQQAIDKSEQVQIKAFGSELTVAHEANSSVTTETTATSPEKCSKINQEESRKTLLSDLMEMSGISTEDTTMTPEFCMDPNINDVLPAAETTPPTASTLPPTIIPITRVTSSIIAPKIVPPDITIAGPYSNLLSFEQNNSTNVLLHYIGQIRPELNAVTTFNELKYVCDNNGTFYKLDIETGSIVPINVCLKRKSAVMPTRTAISGSKEVIDLTDDAGDTDLPQDVPQENNAISVEQDEQDISFEFYSQAKEPTVVKPLKLFKAVRLSEKFKGRSIIKPNIIRKQTGTEKLLFMELPTITAATERYVQPRMDDSSYDSSDDEPLAKKSKRMKTSNKNDEEIVPEPVVPEAGDISADVGSNGDDMGGVGGDIGDNDRDMGDEGDLGDEGDMDDEGDIGDEGVIDDNDRDMGVEDGDISAIEMNNMDIEGVNPELHPVLFEEGSESEDDMCILGV